MLVIIFLIVAVAVWIGISMWSDRQFVPINPNASSYTKSLRPVFSEETLNEVNERTESSFPVLPKAFLDLNTQD